MRIDAGTAIVRTGVENNALNNIPYVAQGLPCVPHVSQDPLSGSFLTYKRRQVKHVNNNEKIY